MSYTQERSASDARVPSAEIWGDFDYKGVRDLLDDSDGWILFWDFVNTDDMVTTTTVDGWYSYLDTSSSGVVRTDVMGGILRLTTDNGGDEEVSIITGDNKHGCVEVESIANSGKKLWFEARVAWGAIVTQSSFVGLCVKGQAKDSGLADDGTVFGDIDFIGFQILEADPDMIDAHSQKNGTAGADVGADAQQIVATTYYKLGIKFDGKKTVTMYVDGVSVGTILTTATTFPVGVELAPYIALKCHTTAAQTMDVDWVRVAQML